MSQQIYEFLQKYFEYAIHCPQIKEAEKFILSGLVLALMHDKNIKIEDALRRN